MGSRSGTEIKFAGLGMAEIVIEVLCRYIYVCGGSPEDGGMFLSGRLLRIGGDGWSGVGERKGAEACLGSFIRQRARYEGRKGRRRRLRLRPMGKTLWSVETGTALDSGLGLLDCLIDYSLGKYALSRAMVYSR